MEYRTIDEHGQIMQPIGPYLRMGVRNNLKAKTALFCRKQYGKDLVMHRLTDLELSQGITGEKCTAFWTMYQKEIGYQRSLERDIIYFEDLDKSGVKSHEE